MLDSFDHNNVWAYFSTSDSIGLDKRIQLAQDEEDPLKFSAEMIQTSMDYLGDYIYPNSFWVDFGQGLVRVAVYDLQRQMWIII